MADDVLIAAYEEKYFRLELRHTDEGWTALRLRHRVGGGWYIEDSIEIPQVIETANGSMEICPSCTGYGVVPTGPGGTEVTCLPCHGRGLIEGKTHG